MRASLPTIRWKIKWRNWFCNLLFANAAPRSRPNTIWLHANPAKKCWIQNIYCTRWLWIYSRLYSPVNAVEPNRMAMVWCVAMQLDFVWVLRSLLATFCSDSYSASIVLTVNFAWIPRNRRQHRPVWAACTIATMHCVCHLRLERCENLFLNPMACADLCWMTTNGRMNFWTWDKHWSAIEDFLVCAPHCSGDEFPFYLQKNRNSRFLPKLVFTSLLLVRCYGSQSQSIDLIYVHRFDFFHSIIFSLLEFFFSRLIKIWMSAEEQLAT